MPITRVLDERGDLAHDCLQLGCEVSWDGYSLTDGTPAEGRSDPGPEWVRVDERTVRLQQPAQQ